MKVLIVVGARPNFMKAAPILRELKEREHQSVLVHTGQHYDSEMSDAFFKDLGLPQPDDYLGVGSGTHAETTARVMMAFEPVLAEHEPDWVVVVGDVDSTLAAALVASKHYGSKRTRIAHVEAGLRSHNWSMPEEVNRVLTDRLSHLLLTPSPDAALNLQKEGIVDGRVRFVGNVMIDSMFHHLPAARERGVIESFGLTRKQYAVVTMHRPANVDDIEVLSEVFAGLDRLAIQLPVLLPLHPRTRERVAAFGLDHLLERITVLEPLGYLQMLGLLDGAGVVLTDSGGIQEETTALGVPCLTLRPETERPITITEGTNQLAPWPPTRGLIGSALEGAGDRDRRDGECPVPVDTLRAAAPDGWDGEAAVRIVEVLEES